MALQKDFDEFLSNIEPSKSTVSYISSIQTNLRDYLKTHDTYTSIYKDSFLSGSYAKHTSIRPVKNDKKRDVDIIVVTEHSQSDNSDEVLQELCDVLLESTKYDTAEVQHHSVGVEMGQVSVDVIPVIVDSDDDSVYWICDSDSGDWTKTDPKGHNVWSTSVNKDHNDKYKPLVKIFKWWRHTNCPEDIKYPKGITLEKIIADNLGDSSLPTEDFLIETMQNIVSAYKSDYVDFGLLPVIDDPSDKIIGNNLLDGYTIDDFAAFINLIEAHLTKLDESGTENDVWREILGNEFPKSTNTKALSNLAVCAYASHRQKPTWPMARGGAVFIALSAVDPNGNKLDYESNGAPLPKGCSLHFRALTGVKQPYSVYWQITNTGDEARAANCLRGNFERSDDGPNGKRESTSYTGSHSVQCFVIKRNACVAKSKDYIINIR